MIAIWCPKCGSPQLRKHGHPRTGQQKYHCKACNRYGMLDTLDSRRQQRQLVEHLHAERVSQWGIARMAGVSRTTIIRWIKKSFS